MRLLSESCEVIWNMFLNVEPEGQKSFVLMLRMLLTNMLLGFLTCRMAGVRPLLVPWTSAKVDITLRRDDALKAETGRWEIHNLLLRRLGGPSQASPGNANGLNVKSRNFATGKIHSVVCVFPRAMSEPIVAQGTQIHSVSPVEAKPWYSKWPLPAMLLQDITIDFKLPDQTMRWTRVGQSTCG